MSNLRDLIDKLKSDKIKEREYGMEKLRETFSQDRTIEKLVKDGNNVNPKALIPVFQALFSTVAIEKATMAKKSTSSKSASGFTSAERRLSNAASLLRWLIERTVKHMNSQVIMVLCEHLTQMLPSSRSPDAELFKPVALDYAKALKCLVSQKVHLQNMKEDTWVKIIEIGFNVILEDPIRSTFAKEGDEPSNELDADMYDDEGSDGISPSISNNPRKRARYERTPTPGPSLATPKLSRPHHIAVSHEQLEFASLLSIMISSPIAPLLSRRYNFLASGILSRLGRFLVKYPSESSLFRDYLNILSSTLRHLSFNKVTELQRFGRSSWNMLVALWGTKDKSMKEVLVVVLRRLFPFVTSPTYVDEQSSQQFDAAKELGYLWDLLDREAENRWGMDRLSLDSLRLQIAKSHGPFVANTFQSGWNFNATQALSWAILELRADCAGQLLQLSESMDSNTFLGSLRTDSKRIKLSDPVTPLLQSIEATASSHIRCYHLQTLLFFIDRHWSSVHDLLKGRIVDALLQYLNFDDPIVQSWVFLNLAAITYGEGTRTNPLPIEDTGHIDSSSWDSIWTHAMRRANVPLVCRAACHTGQLILYVFGLRNPMPSFIHLDSQRLLQEIETLTKDIDVQGPVYPFDSVCNFLTLCLSIASQDVRLYRMRLEDKVLSWFIDNWAIASNKLKTPAHNVQDVLRLLGTICGFSKRVDLIIRPLFPESEIVDLLEEEYKVKTIQDYVLHAKVPLFGQNKFIDEGLSEMSTNSAGIVVEDMNKFERGQLAAPQGRERKVSSFLSKVTETQIHQWEVLQGNNSSPPAESARQVLDATVVAMSFECLLVLNGILPTRHVLQNCGRLLSIVTASFKVSRWTISEKLDTLHSLEVLVTDEPVEEGDTFNLALVNPCPGSGIKEQILEDLLSNLKVSEQVSKINRLQFLRILWQNSDLKDSLDMIMNVMRKLLLQFMGGSAEDSLDDVMDVDDNDGFGPIRINDVQMSEKKSNVNRSLHHLFQICMTTLAYGPFLRSPSGEPTRDKDLADFIIDNTGAWLRPENFFLVCSTLFDNIRHGVLQVSAKWFDSLLDKFALVLQGYQFRKSYELIGLIIHVLDASIEIWMSDPAIQEKVHDLGNWLANAYNTDKIASWSLRDAFSRFLDKYVTKQGTNLAPSLSEELDRGDEADTFVPTSVLLKMNSDLDLRVRFRVSAIHAHIFSLSGYSEQWGMYESVTSSVTNEIDNFEHMLTRMLALANIMIVSSAIRRGPYWHLLETCFYSSSYTKHIEALFNGVSHRLGMESLSMLFEAYASQLAYSISQNVEPRDFLSFPPHLLGYRNRRKCVEAAFRSFTPTNIITHNDRWFENHCKILQKTPIEGLKECFGDIVGSQIPLFINKNPDFDGDTLEQSIREKMGVIEDFEITFKENIDNILVRILRSLGDHDCSKDGPISIALNSFDESGKMSKDFLSLTYYCNIDNFRRHGPNLPAYPANVILQSLSWLSSRIAAAFNQGTTYHVVQELLDEIHRTPLVNEQIRLLSALCLWLAYRQQELDETTLLQTIIHAAMLLLPQSDLTRSAQSILEWAFRRYRKATFKDPHLPNTLTSLCSIAHNFARHSRNPTIVGLGQELISWVDRQVYGLAKQPLLKAVVLQALPAWPQEPSTQLAALAHEVNFDDLSAILINNQNGSNKFRLVRKFRDHAIERHHEKDSRFAKSYFWHFKKHMPPPRLLEDEDIKAFVDLLSLHHGEISSFGIEKSNPTNSRPRQRENARASIMLTLLKMLNSDDALQVSNAYHTLRLIMSIPFESDQLKIPPEYQKTLQYLKQYKRQVASRSGDDIFDSLKSEAYSESATKFATWITMIIVLFSDTLASTDLFFAQLSLILSTDATFSEEIFPMLVHRLLYYTKKEGTKFIALQKLLSNYFTTILLTKEIDVLCIRSIIGVILYLRSFTPPDKAPVDQLAYNNWLQIDFNLLARSAIRCGAFTTALLFVELEWEQRDCDPDQMSASEDVLYEIYAHIDEPDGFYGIKTHNLQRFLIRRFHHEQQWDKAFRFHSAALEAGVSNRDEKEGLVKSFHSFGFNHLAFDSLRSMDESHLSSSSSLNYALGWRTETWDLPDASHVKSSSPLYQSLKAVYRERDPNVLESKLRSALNDEMSHLRGLGTENLVEIREVARNLMCLNQIIDWKCHLTSGHLDPQNMDPVKWKDWIDIDSNFDFPDLESIMATRMALVRSVRQREERQQIGNIVTPFITSLKSIEKFCLLRLSEAARASGNLQIALNSVVRAQYLDTVPSSNVSEEFANVLWLQKEERLAVQFLQGVVSKFSVEADGEISARLRKASLLARLGTWTSEACLEKPQGIWEKYFSSAISILDQIDDDMGQYNASRAAIFRECAVYAERQYHSISSTADVQRMRIYAERTKEEYENSAKKYKDMMASAPHEASTINKLKKIQLIAENRMLHDLKIFKEYNGGRETFLQQAIEMHSRCLGSSDNFDNDSAIRLCSLWFSNFDNPSIFGCVRRAIEHTPSRKFVFLAHQLTARITSPVTSNVLTQAQKISSI